MASEYALCTLEDVNALRQKGNKLDSEAMTDLIDDMLIDQASVACMNFAEREFAPVTPTASREFVYNGTGVLDLAPYDLVSATSVEFDTQGESARTLTAGSDFFLRPKPSKYGVYNYIVGLPVSQDESEVTITGAWGFPTVPPDVVRACALTVAIWIRNLGAIPKGMEGDDLTNLEIKAGVPSAARLLLSHYRKSRAGY